MSTALETLKTEIGDDAPQTQRIRGWLGLLTVGNWVSRRE